MSQNFWRENTTEVSKLELSKIWNKDLRLQFRISSSIPEILQACNYNKIIDATIHLPKDNVFYLELPI